MLDNVKREMERLRVNILGLCEVRRKGSDEIPSDNYTFIYSGGQKHERGVGFILDQEYMKSKKKVWKFSDRICMIKLSAKPFDINIIQVYAPTTESKGEEIDQFYSEMETALKKCKPTDNTIIQGDFNAIVGKGTGDKNVGAYGLGQRNDRGNRLVGWVKEHDLIIGNTIFCQPSRRLWTWKSPGDRARNQIDYVMIKKRFRNSLISCKTYPGVDCNSDHVPIISKIRLRLKKLRITKKEPLIDYKILKTDQTLRMKYSAEVKKEFDALEGLGDIEQQWKNLKECINKASQKIIPKVKRNAKQKWMSDEILNLMEERRDCNRNTEEYKTLHRKIKTKCKKAKEDWLKQKCKEVEDLPGKDLKAMHKKIEYVTGRKKTNPSSGYLKSKEGDIIKDKLKILERWEEYIKDLYGDNERNEHYRIRTNTEGPQILKSEVEYAMKKTKKGKAPGPDNITIELLEALEEFGVDQITKILNNIYDTSEIPEDLSKSIFITLPKKAGAIECELYSTISLMSHLTKILLRIIMNRTRNKIRPGIAQEQCGFVEGKGTANAIYTLKTVIERSIEVQQDLYLCFIDSSKAFDTVKHEKLIQMLQDLNVDGKDLKLIRNMYWQQTAAIKINNKISGYQKIEKGLRQGCVLSRDLYSLYSEIILRNIKGRPGIGIGGVNINNLRYADDIVLIAGKEEELQELISIINGENGDMGLSLDIKKTETMVISKKNDPPTCHINLDNKKLQQVDKIKYLGTWILLDGRCKTEVTARIIEAKENFGQMKHLLINRSISLTVRMSVLRCYIWPILMYGCEAWTINKEIENRLKAVEMWFIRRMLRFAYMKNIRDEEVLEKAETTKSLVNEIRKRQATFFGHVMRKSEMEHLVTTGKIDGKRSRGRQREKMLDSITSWLHKENKVQTISCTRNRDEWISMIENAIRENRN